MRCMRPHRTWRAVPVWLSRTPSCWPRSWRARGAQSESALAAFTERRFERCQFVVDSSVEIGRRQLELAPAEEIGMRMGKGLAVLAQPI